MASFNSNPYRKLHEKFMQNVTQTLNEMESVVLSAVDDNFRNKSFFGEKWERNTTNTPILVKSGNLRTSIKTLKSTQYTRKIGTNVPYAYAHNYGTTFKSSPQQIKFFYSQFYKTKDETFLKIANSLKSGRQIKIPQRQFIGDHPELIRRLRATFNRTMYRF